MDLISMVLGILSSGFGCTDLRLTFDLKRVFIRVDFPRPLCPDQENTHSQRDLNRSFILRFFPPKKFCQIKYA